MHNDQADGIIWEALEDEQTPMETSLLYLMWVTEDNTQNTN